MRHPAPAGPRAPTKGVDPPIVERTKVRAIPPPETAMSAFTCRADAPAGARATRPDGVRWLAAVAVAALFLVLGREPRA